MGKYCVNTQVYHTRTHLSPMTELSVPLRVGGCSWTAVSSPVFALRILLPLRNRSADGNLPKAKRRTRMMPESNYARFKNTKPQPSGLLGPVTVELP